MSAAVGRIHSGNHVAFINQHLPVRRQGGAKRRAGRVRQPLQELAMLGIAKIESLMPVVCACQVGACHYRLGFARLKGKSSGALGLDDGGNRGLAIHLYDGQ